MSMPTTPNAQSDPSEEVAKRCATPAERAAFWEALEGGRAQLLAKIRAGMGPGLLRLCEPEDILQEALVRALDPSTGALAAVSKNPAMLQPWLLGVARNRILELAWRGRARTRPRIRTALPPALLVLDDALLERHDEKLSGGPSEPPDLEALERAIKVINSLTAEQRLCVVLRDLQDLPLSTVAFVLGRSKRAAAKLHQRALRQLEARTRTEVDMGPR